MSLPLPEMTPDFALSHVGDPQRRVVDMGKQVFGMSEFLCAKLVCGHVAPVSRYRTRFESVGCHRCAEEGVRT